MNRHLTSWTAIAGAAALAAGGCANPCEGFNPYERYERVADPINEPDRLETVEPGKFRLACFNSGEPQVIEQALQQALRDGGGGQLSRLSDPQEVANLLDFARGAGGPYASRRPRIGRYEVTFRSEGLDALAPMTVEWKGNVNPVRLDVNQEDAVVTLLDLGQGEFKLIFAAEAGLRAEGPQLQARGQAYGFRTRQFDLETKADGRAVPVSIISEQAEILEPPVLLYEVTGFGGDVSAFLCNLLRENRELEGQEGLVASFEMRQTDVWLDSRSWKGSVQRGIHAVFTQNSASGKAENLQVEIAGLGSFSASSDLQQQGYTLEARFLEDSDQVVLEFDLPKPERDPEDDFVTFIYTINGKEYRQKVARD